MEFDAAYFDEASKQWRANKKQITPGFFLYTCNYIHTKNNKKCNKVVYNVNYAKYRYYTTTIEETVRYHRNGNRYCKKHLNSETWKIKN